MFTERVGQLTNKYPWLCILAILLITAGATASMVIFPMETSFSNEDFLPDIDVAKANSLYSETFTSSYPFIVLIRGQNGDLVTPEGFSDMAELSDLLEKDDTYQEWGDEGSAGPVSAASAMFDLRNGADHADNMKMTASMVSSYLEIIDSLVNSSLTFSEDLSELTEGEDPTPLVSSFSLDIQEMMDEVEIPSLNTTTPETAMEYYSSFNDTEEFKLELADLLAYDISGPDVQSAIGDLNFFPENAQRTLDALSEARDGIDEYIDMLELTPGQNSSLRDLQSNIDDAIERLEGTSEISQTLGNPLVFGQVTRTFSIGQFFLLNFLTEDFDPSVNSLSAKGGMVLVDLNYSLGEMEENGQLNKLLEIEGNLSKVVKGMDDRSDQSMHSMAFAKINEKITQASNDSMQILLPLAMIFVLVILFFIYRSVIDIVLNIIALVMAIIWMYGFGSLMGYSSNPMITAVPVLLVGLGIDYGIHLTMRYREEIRKGLTVREALKEMSSSVGMALLLATFTTVFAFLSNLSSPVGLILQFGVMAAVGIFASFVIMMVFLPSTKRLIDVWRAERKKSLFRGIREGECDLCEREKVNKRLSNRVILALSLRAEKHPIVILVSAVILTSVMFGFAIQSEVTFSVNDFLPDGLQESEDISYLIGQFRLGGSGDTGIIIVEGDISDPKVLLAMDETMKNAVDLDSRFLTYEGTGSSLRPKADFILYSLKDTANMLGALDPDDQFLADYSDTFDLETGLPLENSTKGDIEKVLVDFYEDYPSLARRMIHVQDGKVDMAVISFVVGTEDDDQAWKLFDELKDIVGPLKDMEGDGVEKVSITGSTILMAVIIEAINNSQIRSLVLTIIVSFVALTIAFFIEEKSLFLGGVATLPVVFCVIWIAGTMYVTGIPLNVMTITIGALTVGLGITYGIHITHRFIEDERNESDLLEASKKTIVNTGSALFGAALTTVGGFGLLSFATMPPLQQFGQVTALAILYSFVSSIIILPVLLILWAKSRRKWRARKAK